MGFGLGTRRLHMRTKVASQPTGSSSLVPRPHPLMRRNSLVNQVEFLGLVGALATL